MKEAKQIFLFLGGAIVFIVVIGIITNRSQGKPLLGNIELPVKTETPQTYKKISIASSNDGKVKDIELSVAVADDANERRKGLSGYTNLPENEGMLFTLEKKEMPIFWMKDMKISIDILWIEDGRLVDIDKNIQPEPGIPDKELKKYQPSTLVDYVLEVSSGWSDRNNIKIGDPVDI